MKLFTSLFFLALLGMGCEEETLIQEEVDCNRIYQEVSFTCSYGKTVTGTQSHLEGEDCYSSLESTPNWDYICKDESNPCVYIDTNTRKITDGKAYAIDSHGTTLCELNSKTHAWEPVK